MPVQSAHNAFDGQAMALGDFFSSVASRLFGPAQQVAPAQEVERGLLEMTIEGVVAAVDPRLRAVSGYRSKLEPGARATILHLRKLARALPDPMLLTRAEWSANPLVAAFFARADDVPESLARSHELREFLDRPGNAAVPEVFALLGMRMSERTFLGPALVDGVLREDVQQRAVNFSEHRLVAPAPEYLACRREIGDRILRRIAAIALERTMESGRRTEQLAKSRAVLSARLRLLRLNHGGLQEAVQDAPDDRAEIKRLEDELKTVGENYAEAKSGARTLDSILDIACDIFGNPQHYVSLTPVRRRLNRMSVVVPENSGEPAENLEFQELAVGDGLRGVIAFVRIPGIEIPRKKTRFADAGQHLI